MSRRRTRWTVTKNDGSREVFLSYGPDAAANYFGVPVSQVRKGDYRVEAEVAQRRPSGARPLKAALRSATQQLGLKFPVEVKMNGRLQGAFGHHMCSPLAMPRVKGGYMRSACETTPAAYGGWVHRIMVKDWLSAEDMGRYLWHELTHAVQWEREVDFSGSVLDAMLSQRAIYNNGVGYEHKRWEKEANEAMERNALHPLAGNSLTSAPRTARIHL